MPLLERRSIGQKREAMLFWRAACACIAGMCRDGRWARRSCGRDRQLALRLMAFLDFTAAEGSVDTTGDLRGSRAASRSVSWNRSGASARARCHST